MAIFFDAPVAPEDLTTFVRTVPLPSNLVLSNEFPEVVRASNQVDWSEITQTNRTARFRSYDGRIHVSDRDGSTDKSVKLPALSDSLNMGEYERLQLEFARTGGTRQEALADAIYNDADRLVRHVRNRMELAMGDVLTDGKLTINENGYMGEADFGVPGTHLVTAGTPWTTIASAAALTDLIAWLDVYVATNGTPPGAIRMSRRIQRLLQTNAQIIGAAVGSSSGKTRVNLEELRDLFQAEGLPTVFRNSDTVLDVDGVTTRTIPDDRLIFEPADPGDLAEFRYGLSATALELVNSAEADTSFEDGAGIVGVVEKVGPPYRQFTFVDAVGMPILRDAKKLFVADVA
jgi:hypothetical protein